MKKILLLALLASPTLVCAQATTLTEGFDTSPPPTWTIQNNSFPTGSTSWFQGNTDAFAAQAGAATSYAGANFNNIAGVGTISNWLITPVLALRNGSTVTFWARAAGNTYPDRLQVRLSTAGTSTNVGSTNTSTGDFGTLLLDINPAYDDTSFPDSWVQHTLTLSGLPTAGVAGRVAFRYFVEDGGEGARSNYIGLDTFSFTGTAPLPVQLASFTAQAQPASTRLAWATVSELHNAYFAVERSADGRAFTELGRVAGAGSTQQPRAYTYLDAYPLPGLNYYRLRQVDVDGTAQFSPLVSVRGQELTLSFAPNPVREQATFTSSVATTLIVRDALGRAVQTLELSAGTQQISLSALPVGIYSLTDAATRHTVRLVKNTL